jgi:hypothetical protein
MQEGFTLVCYQDTTTGTLTNSDMTAVADQVFSRRNGHYFFTADFKILASGLYGANSTRAIISSPTLNAFTAFNIWPINTSNVSANPPKADLWMEYPPPLPKGEEIQILHTTSGSDTTTAMLIIGSAGWTKQVPRGIGPVPVFEARFTCSITLAAQQWSTPATMTLEQSLRAGTYAVVGCDMMAANLMFFRLIFNRPKFYMNVPLRPGSVANNALGDAPLGYPGLSKFLFGEWGRFATTELPQIEALGIGTATVTAEGRLYLVRLSDALDVQYNS